MGLTHSSDFTTSKMHDSMYSKANKVTVFSNDVKFIPQNFEAIALLPAELCLVKIRKLDACIS